MVGCLRNGTFTENVVILRGGQPRKRITLRAFPGASAAVCGYIEITETANYVTVSHLTIDGSCSTQQKVQVWGDYFTLKYSEVDGRKTGSGSSCVFLGHPTFGVAHNALIDHNRIHGCGTTVYGHGLYVDDSRGAVITNNFIYDNGGFGIQLYPDAQHSQVTKNIIDGNGFGSVIFAGEDSSPSSDNTVRYNVLSNPGNGHNLMASWGGAYGSGNLAERNCLWPPGKGLAPNGGFIARDNVVANPRFRNRVAGDFRLSSGSRCSFRRLQRR
jgi:parallel beta-helix repeat protein